MPRTASPAARRTPRASSRTRACALSASRPSSRGTCRRACRLRRRAASTEQAPPRVSSRVLPAGRCWHLDPTRRVLDLSPQRRRSAATSRMSRPRERSAALRRGFFCALTRCRAACRAPVPSLESLRPPWTPPLLPLLVAAERPAGPGRAVHCAAHSPRTPDPRTVLSPLPRSAAAQHRHPAGGRTSLPLWACPRLYVIGRPLLGSCVRAARARPYSSPPFGLLARMCVCRARLGVFLRSAGSRHVICLHDMYQTVWTPHRQTECARQASPIDKTIATRQSPSARGDED
mmetsp:Transcript_1528/g.4939  ORF Transcript_1528/g.4939 Transcript_1528/m.4939 type:complete len:289 (+) Transcript_1528:992-1858(+)